MQKTVTQDKEFYDISSSTTYTSLTKPLQAHVWSDSMPQSFALISDTLCAFSMVATRPYIKKSTVYKNMSALPVCAQQSATHSSPW